MKKLLYVLLPLLLTTVSVLAQRTQKPVLHAKHWIAITGKPLGATAGATTFNKGGNAVDAACAMLAATSTMWDVLSWGGETQALIYNPKTKKVIGINALGVAPTGATPEFFEKKEMKYPPQYGPLAAVTPGTPGGLMTMLAEYGTLSLEEVLKPAMQMAEGYPIEAQTANGIERSKKRIKEWPYSKEVFLTHPGAEREAPEAGEIFKQPDLLNTLTKLVEAEQKALSTGKSRKEAIYAAYDRFYKGDIAEEFVRGCQEQGGLITMEDLANWKVYVEEPVSTDYKGIEVYKLTSWVQGPVMLQSLNMLENFDLQAMGYNSIKYIHTLYQVMNMTFADRDFYYGDPYFPPEEPMKGLLSKEYAKARIKEINWSKNDENIGPGDPYPFQGGTNPYLKHISEDKKKKPADKSMGYIEQNENVEFPFGTDIYTGTTSIQTADAEGWVVSITPSGGWIPAVIAGNTGVGMSQRAQSFVIDESENPYNVIAPGKRPRATLTPALAMKDGKPYISMAVQGGDSQDQNLLQFFLNMVEFDMNVQEAAEAGNFNSYQLKGSFGEHKIEPGRLLLHESTPPFTRKKLREMGYKTQYGSRTSGPINAIYFDWKHKSFWGGSSNHGEDYGIGW
ncbi:gamma-glutamyltransferase [Fulvivirgaceae bacterium BMA10]|uniref:Gamma-glutamyltransferase n=1 Tax=Splendidivirga corallicola TaxID=3051826 RepID=A0ABT8KZ66_9BACT|nr:gamma-glutamyltransferase [Fulvivirgaceae bacterium BMA10]